jgi:hypothetical protein
MQPHIHLFSLYMGFKVNIWAMHLCVFWTCSHVMRCPCNSSGRRRKIIIIINEVKEKKKLFSSAHHHYRASGRRSLYSVVVGVVTIRCCPLMSSFVVRHRRCLVQSLLSSIAITVRHPSVICCHQLLDSIYLVMFDVRHVCSFGSICLAPFVHRCPSVDICPHMSVAIHPHQHHVFFKLYVLHIYIFDIVFFKPYLVLCIATKFWGMGEHHVLGWWKHYRSAKAKVSTTK